MGTPPPTPIWVARDYTNCSGCRRCEVACSLKHEGRIWPEASRVRVFMLVPSLEIPHLCSQCDDAPCVPSCPVKALSISKTTGAVLVDQQKCIACGACIDACPGRVPVMHPKDGYALICDLCDGDPECAKACQEGRYNALWTVKKPASPSYKLYAKTPDKVTKELAYRLYGDIAEGLL
jgi:Fe-S-cluster-containing dehydrogenase component